MKQNSKEKVGKILKSNKGLRIQNVDKKNGSATTLLINQPKDDIVKNRFFHYTREDLIPTIINSQVIKFEKYQYDESEKPIAWASSNPNWENTATKSICLSDGILESLTFAEQVDCCGCARIQIKPTFKLHNWKIIARLANMQKEYIKPFENAGKKMGGNPNEWFGSLVPIPIDEWMRIEIYQNGKWIIIINFENGIHVNDFKSRFFIIPNNNVVNQN
ncbi:hypothetical protein [Flavobacterium gilvum]|uniref:Uncharacterized protein n=1 Tax=Flavobacterium gilvum TaxID=1492737 RepID=A0AAC9I4Z1_9FLAO|nr:hypothetical protein [Flavobacterium gilvum]AOW10531.1 hypothetical protein EM308_14035 [Flavobacterium gilvum]KFC57820.1 hypothetical protein FEM08_33850 [Flavobacterium gilvum]